MKTQLLSSVAVFMLVLSLLSPGHASENPLAFTWQGILIDGDQALEGQYDLRLRLFDAPEGGNQLGFDIVLPQRRIFDGKFYGTLDFGVDVFDGQTHWLEFAYKSIGVASPYRVLWAPRSPVKRTHYEVMAENGEFHKSLAVLCPVGIGTTSPSNRLSVLSSTGGDGIAVVNDSGSSRVLASIAGGDWGFVELNDGSGSLTRIAPNYSWFDGLVGIGTNNPQGKLDVNGDLVVKTTGNVGIGTTSPPEKMTVSGNQPAFMLEHDGVLVGVGGGTTSFGVIKVRDSQSTGPQAYINLAREGVSSGDGDLPTTIIFATTADGSNIALERMRINNIGNVGIGTASPGAKLEVAGDIAEGSVIKCTNAGGGIAVKGEVIDGWGVYGRAYGSHGIGVYGESDTDVGPYSYAGYFWGNVNVTRGLTKGYGSFKIDHPLDPENKYLQHSFVESPDMMNVYNGNFTLDENGQALVQLPEYFEALNRDFRYQLTCIGGFAPVYIAEKISHNRFKIAGGKAGMEVSWQVTGVRRDPCAVANRIQVEEDKSAEERGYYLHPKAYGLPEEKGIETVRNPRSSQTQEVAKKELSSESNKHYN